MIQFLDSTSTVRLIDQIVIDAEDNLVLVSASPRFSAELMNHLKSADDRGVSITLMVDDVLFEENASEPFSEFKNFSVFRCRDLNGHCYASEREIVVTSLGLSDEIPTGVHMGTAFSNDEPAYAKAMESLAELRESVSLLDKMIKSRSRPEYRTVGKNEERSPLLRVIKGGLRKKFGRTEKNESYSKSHSCVACDKTLDELTVDSLCPACEQRKNYQHTALYLANDLTA